MGAEHSLPAPSSARRIAHNTARTNIPKESVGKVHSVSDEKHVLEQMIGGWDPLRASSGDTPVEESCLPPVPDPVPSVNGPSTSAQLRITKMLREYCVDNAAARCFEEEAEAKRQQGFPWRCSAADLSGHLSTDILARHQCLRRGFRRPQGLCRWLTSHGMKQVRPQ